VYQIAPKLFTAFACEQVGENKSFKLRARPALSSSFLDRTVEAQRPEIRRCEHDWDNPGRPGKGWWQLVPLSPPGGESRREAYITSSSGRNRIRSVSYEPGTERPGVIRNRARAESGPRNVSVRAPTQLPQRVLVATAQTRTLSRFPAGRPRQKAQPAARVGYATESRWRGGSGPRQSPSKLLKGAVPQNEITPLQKRKQPER
jgi:hypothetical protein